MDDLTYVITELPVGKWTQDYKKFLTELAIPEKKTPVISDFKENHTDTTVHFTIILNPEQAKALEGQDLYKFFKIETPLKITNFNLFDEKGHIHHYNSPEEIIDSFFDFRYPLYQVRKDHLIARLEKEVKRLSNKARFVLAVVNGELVVSNRKRQDVMADLVRMGFDTFYPDGAKSPVIEGMDGEEDEKLFDEQTKDLSRGYDYLLSMKIWTLTKELVDLITKQVETCMAKLEKLKNTSTKTMWENDLDAFVEELMKVKLLVLSHP